MKTILLLLALSQLAVPFGMSAANSAAQARLETHAGIERTKGLSIGAAPVSFAGTWNTLAGGTHQYTVILKQVGNRVTGSYTPGNGKIFDGVVVGNKVTFKWTQDGDWEGSGEFTLDADGKGFKGSSTALKPQEFTTTWNSFVSEPMSLAGVWETTSNNAQFTMTLQQVGTTVIGSYTPGNGTIEGTITDNILRFKWTSDSGKGSGRFVIDKGEMIFSGSYSNSDDPDKVDGMWIGTRKMGGTGGKAPPVSVAGVWVATTRSAGPFRLTLQQAGYQVTGKMKYLRIDVTVDLTEVTLVGNRLRFTAVFSSSPVKVELVMAEDGKSLKGEFSEETLTFVLQKP